MFKFSNLAPFLACILCLILKISGSNFLTFNLTKNSFVEVKDKDGSFLPLCADSFTEILAEQICNQQNLSYVDSFQLVPLSDILSLNVYCQNPENCTQYLAFSCSNGIELHCDHRPPTIKCPKNAYLFGQSKCVFIPNKIFNAYENAKDFCGKQNFTLLSMSSGNITNQINNILKILKRSKIALSSDSKLLTSGIRKNNQWIWEDNVIFNNSVNKGKGRCLGLFVDELIAVNCSNETLIPICELNLATNCVLKNGIYDGILSKTKSGFNCLIWNNPGPGQHSELFPDQKLWSHNYCRNPGKIRQMPWCLVAANTFQECTISVCSNTSQMMETLFVGCSFEENRCGLSDQCVDKDYFCDYEIDCRNGFDEHNCPDHLAEFDFIGTFKLADEVNEIWTHIPHVQGCAQRCIRTQNFRCESFSYDEIQRLCLLSSILSNPAIIVNNDESKYYRRRFSNTTLSYRVEPSTMTIMIEKNSISTALCLDDLNDTVIDVLCEQFGFGQPLKALPSSLNVAYVWTVDCLRNPKCYFPNKEIFLKEKTFGFCNSVLRCSTCHPNIQFACLSTGYCISTDKVCNNFDDCVDGSDEEGCQNPQWRLIGTNESNSGRVQLFRQNSWADVCIDDLDESHTNILCQSMKKGFISQILPLTSQFMTSTTYKIVCTKSKCSAKGVGFCQNGILNLRCFQENEQKCGVRLLSSKPIDKKSKRRFARVVNGSNTVPGAYPWTAAVKLKLGKSHHCGASVISANYLLSAAHCFQNKEPKDYLIIVGDWNSSVVENTEQIFTVSEINFYPLYEDIFQHDIVLIKINGTMKFDNYVQPICLPPIGFKYNEGEVCTVTGWGSNGTVGFDSVSIMQAAALPILNRETCLQSSNLYSVMSRTSFCAGYFDGGVDSCQGDSGGPFACEYKNHFYLAGIISWGDSCAQAGQPGIYTMVLPYLTWIKNVTVFLAIATIGFCYIFITSLTAEKTFVFLSSKNFSIRGIKTEEGNFFVGIEYAKTKTFERPVYLPLEGKLDAVTWGAACKDTMSFSKYRTCLYLNIFRCGNYKSKNLQQVLVYIGSGRLAFSGVADVVPNVAINKYACKGSIFVSVNYRQGAFGNFVVGAKKRINNGVHDVKTALEWIQNNIAYFGGNSQNVTILAAGNGARIASLLSRLPESESLFHQLILTSGSSFIPNFITSFKEAQLFSQKFALSTNCSNNENWPLNQWPVDAVDVYDCLDKKNLSELSSHDDKLDSRTLIQWPFVEDDDLFTNLTDSAIPTLFLVCLNNEFQQNSYQPKHLTKILHMIPEFNTTEFDWLRKYYVKKLTDPNAEKKMPGQWKIYQTIHEIQDNFNIFGPSILEAQSIASNQGLSYYVHIINRNKNDTFISHTPYCLGEDLFEAVKPIKDVNWKDEYGERMSEIIMNFVVKADPTPTDSVVSWPWYAPNTPEIVVLNGKTLQSHVRPVESLDVAKFWLCEAGPRFIENATLPDFCYPKSFRKGI